MLGYFHIVRCADEILHRRNMKDTITYQELKIRADEIQESFKRDFARFERFAIDRFFAESFPNLVRELQLEQYSLVQARKDLTELGYLKTKYAGKKSDWAVIKKQIGRVSDALDRASAGQYLVRRLGRVGAPG